MGNLFDAIDWADIFRVEPGIGLTIVSKEGDLLYTNEAALSLFGLSGPDAPQRQPPKHLKDVFHPDFVRERLGWIQKVIEDEKPLRATHIYQGQRLVSTFYPIAESTAQQFRGMGEADHENRIDDATTGAEEVDSHQASDPADGEQNEHYALIISRRDGQEASSAIDTVSSQFIDLGCLSSLSKRELEIFILLGHGNSVPEVARMLHRSPRTVERHKTEIGRKLGYSSLAEIARAVGHVGLTYDHIQLERFKALSQPKQ
ncbi:Bacterial regulatory protein, luxR family [Planctomycetes bacterium CA13]|uniref:Bacterial regulatory protein, luxR family n=1 Tax=Novipirellula herctigrandis TaxID=2527986 RepID=A0A5C5Z647_9BACT|nr:Bacterial regulatory protein, luxR family [Planctomycetes bacterium CA13]